MTQRIVIVTEEEAMSRLAENIGIASKELDALTHYIFKTSLAEMLQDELGKGIIKKICDAANGISCYANVLDDYAKGEAKLGTEKEWLDYVDELIDRSGKYTQAQLDEAVANAVETATKNAYRETYFVSDEEMKSSSPVQSEPE